VGGSSSTGGGTLFGDLIEKVYRRCMGGIRERAVQLNGAIGSDDTSVVLQGLQTSGVAPGTTLGIELELLYVDTWDSGTLTAVVLRGYLGSTPSAHIDGTITYINPRYSRYDIGVAINDDLRDLSAPDNGLFRVGVVPITFNPTYMGYDLGDVPANFLDIIQLRFKEATPYKRFPRITNYEVLRNIPDAQFPSGQGLRINEDAWPGLPMYATYTAPFVRLVDESDDVTNTPSTNDTDPPFNGYSTMDVVNLPSTMVDIPPLGAEVDLTQPREISRNFMDSQPDPRKALEVVAGAVAASANTLMARRQRRIQAEAGRLARQYRRRRW
jgi:hypothetical protein